MPASEEASTLLKDGFGPQRSNSNTYILAECKQKSLSRTICVIININNLTEITHETGI